MEENNGGVQLHPIKMEFSRGNDRETGGVNINQWEVGVDDSFPNVKTEAPIPMYNLYPIKEEVVDQEPSSNMLTSIVESETEISQYFDHSSIVQQNLKTEPEDEEENCKDPLDVGDSVPLGETAQVFGHYSSEEKDTTIPWKPFKCESCGKSFTSNKSLTYHLRTHTGEGEKPFECETCGKCFAFSSQLTRHKIQMLHTGQNSYKKPFACDTCGKAFADRITWIYHSSTYCGEKPFGCETCGKTFPMKGSLKDHLKTHTGEKPFGCDTCGKTFPMKGSLKDHLKTHTGEKPFECETCGKSFARRSHLTRHKERHAGEKGFKCETCGMCFLRKKWLADHVTAHV